MIYSDSKEMYGITEITDSSVSELLRSAEVLRLHGVDQYGYRFKENFYPHAKTASRFQHTLGVLSLCKMFNIDVFNQIFAVLHDTAHTAFSHVGDIAIQGFKSDQNYHDLIRENYVRSSENISVVFKKYEIDIDFILNPVNFPLVKCEQPYVSADNLDYCLRFGLDFGIIDIEKARYFLSSLFIKGNRWIFKDFESAKEFAEFVLLINDEYFCGWQSAVMMQTVSEWLKYALDKGYINSQELYDEDKNVIKQINLKLFEDEYLRKLFYRMENPKLAEVYDVDRLKAVKFSNLNLKKISLKSRVVNPLFIIEEEGGRIHSLSEYDINWWYKFEKSKLPKEYCIKFNY